MQGAMIVAVPPSFVSLDSLKCLYNGKLPALFTRLLQGRFYKLESKSLSLGFFLWLNLLQQILERVYWSLSTHGSIELSRPN